LARRLFQELGGADEVCYLLHDYYYKDLSHLTLEERADNNFDHPDSLETDLMIHHIQQLKHGHGCTIPTYDFTTHSRKPPEASIQMEPRKIILLEGILILAHPELRKEMDIKVYVVCW
jgi:uridine kinase